MSEFSVISVLPPVITGGLGIAGSWAVTVWRHRAEQHVAITSADAEMIAAKAAELSAENERLDAYRRAIDFWQEKAGFWEREAEEWREKFWRTQRATEKIVTVATNAALDSLPGAVPTPPAREAP